jgi:hypothetical protein
MDEDVEACKFCGTSVAPAEPAPPAPAPTARRESALPFSDEPMTALPYSHAPSPDPTATARRDGALPYSDGPSPRFGIDAPNKLVIGAVAGVALLLVAVGVMTLSGDDEPTGAGSRVTAVAAPTIAPLATTTTGLTALTTTSIPPKSGLAGRTVPIGTAGVFSATMPAGTTAIASDKRSSTWGATLPGGSSVTFKAQTAASVPDRYKTSVGRIDVAKYGTRVNSDLGVTGTPPRFGAFATGSGAEWDTSSAGQSGRVTLIDGGSMAYLLVLQHAGGLPVDDVAAYLAVSASLRPA